MIGPLLEEVSLERVIQDLRRLTGEEAICTVSGCSTIVDRETGSQGLQWAKEYVYEQLFGLGYEVELQDWSRSDYSDQNIIARKTGVISPDEHFYFVAHLDDYRADGADRAPAADDNASGVASLLEVARVLNRHSFVSTLVFLITTGEEHGTLGARSHLDELSEDELVAIKYMVDVEMLGYDADRDGVMQLWSGNHAPSLLFAQMLSAIISSYEIDLTPRIVTGCT
jgi:acetylornithine deacetylase/succinyl-diaminopimelate desuccinylase-like protein